MIKEIKEKYSHKMEYNSKLETERVSGIVPTKRVEFKPRLGIIRLDGSLVLCNNKSCLVPAIGSVRIQVLKYINSKLCALRILPL
jgi:hypothetical protein